MLKTLKDKAYYYAVSKNKNIDYEYGRYVAEHIKTHNILRLWHWAVLFRLNWHYRIARENTYLIYPPIVKKKPAPAKRQVRLPYVSGPESIRFRRPSECTFANSLLAYDVVSFDIFDTLILRPFSQPIELFMILGYKFDIMDFLDIRRKAEQEARQLRKEEYGDTEITIYDIYERIHVKTGLDIEFGVKTEFETEKEFCFANPYMKRVFKMLKAQGKKLLAVSDMYLPRPMIEELLESCGYTGFLEIFVSCDYRFNKREGYLYDIVKDQIGREYSYAHVGDNFNSDIKSAKEKEIKAFYYKNVHELGNPVRCDGMSELVGGAYRGIVNTHLYNGSHSYSIPYEFGFIYGGLYVLGYCNWIHSYALQHGISKILFLSRDGAIYQRVFNFLFNDVENEYVYWSRIANLKYASVKFKDDFIKRAVIHRSGNVVKMSIQSLLDSLNLSALLPVLYQYNLSPESLIIRENVEPLIRFFTDNWEIVVTLLDENDEYVKNYLLEVINGHKKIAIVDVGWQGTGPLGIKYLITQKWKFSCEIDCLVAAARIYTHNGNLHTLMGGNVIPYMFSRMFNRNLYDTHANTNNNTNNIYFELFTQALSPSFAGWNHNGSFQFEIPEVENYKMITEIHQGIFDFCGLYRKTFYNYELMFNISGYDAYLPYRFIIRDLSYFKRFFGSFRYSRSVLADKNAQNLEALSDIMNLARV